MVGWVERLVNKVRHWWRTRHYQPVEAKHYLNGLRMLQPDARIVEEMTRTARREALAGERVRGLRVEILDPYDHPAWKHLALVEGPGPRRRRAYVALTKEQPHGNT